MDSNNFGYRIRERGTDTIDIDIAPVRSRVREGARRHLLDYLWPFSKPETSCHHSRR